MRACSTWSEPFHALVGVSYKGTYWLWRTPGEWWWPTIGRHGRVLGEGLISGFYLKSTTCRFVLLTEVAIGGYLEQKSGITLDFNHHTEVTPFSSAIKRTHSWLRQSTCRIVRLTEESIGGYLEQEVEGHRTSTILQQSHTGFVCNQGDTHCWRRPQREYNSTDFVLLQSDMLSSSSSAFPIYISGFTSFGWDFCVCDRFLFFFKSNH